MTAPRVLPIAEFRRLIVDGTIGPLDGGGFVLDPADFPTPPGAPESPEYRDAVLAQWQSITGRNGYQAGRDESFPLDQSIHLRQPFPYSTGDAVHVGWYLGAVAETVGSIGLEPPARIVELGSGWGHLALALATTGFDVTAVDVNEASVELLMRRAAATGVKLDIQRAGFLDVDLGRADAIVFFESFHHCDRPFELLDRCVSALLPGGRLIFVAEAVYSGYRLPWGVRLDGWAAAMSATAGWLELGFDEAFFDAALAARGLCVERRVQPSLGPYGTFLTAIAVR